MSETKNTEAESMHDIPFNLSLDDAEQLLYNGSFLARFQYFKERTRRAESKVDSQALEIERLTRELAEEKTACQIAGQATEAMRETIERKDEEIRLLRICKRADALHIAAVIAGIAEAVQNFTKQRMDAHSELDEFDKANPK